MKKMVAVVLFLALIACAFSGCAEESPVETKSAPAPMPAPMPPTMTKQGDTAISVGGGTADYQYVDTNTEQKIIQRASLSIEVVDFQASSNALILIVERSDGFVSDSYSYVTGTGYKRGDFTIRVPTDEFLSVISEIEQIGTVKSKHTSGQDVTEEYIDLKARINNLERQEQRLLEILDMANTTQEVLVVEKEIWRVRSEIEQLTGRINYLENRIELATISVSLYEQEPITHSWGIRDAFRAAFEAFVSTIRGLIILVGYVVPILILVGLGWLIKSKLMPKLRKGKEGKVKE
ncbi:MAG: DUF4349 domain-containing protein [Methanocellales archaeon]|nr:DUF4349 domain-containing protein [Methanocellales archaeon]